MLEQELQTIIVNTLADEYTVLTQCIERKINKPGYCSLQCKKDIQRLFRTFAELKKSI